MNAIQILEQTKANLAQALDECFDNRLGNRFADRKVSDNLYQESRSIIKVIANERGLTIPDFIKTSRSIDEAVDDLTNELREYDSQYTVKKYR